MWPSLVLIGEHVASIENVRLSFALEAAITFKAGAELITLGIHHDSAYDHRTPIVDGRISLMAERVRALAYREIHDLTIKDGFERGRHVVRTLWVVAVLALRCIP